MRLLRTVFFIFLAEVILACGLFSFFRVQVAQEKGEMILRSNIMAMFYAYQGVSPVESFRRYFYDFGYPGIGAIFKNPMQLRGGYPISSANLTELAVILRDEIDNSNDPHLKHALYYPQSNRIQEYENIIAVNLPLYRDNDQTPYALVRITHQIKHLPRDVFFKNLLSYFIIFLLYNSLLIMILLYYNRSQQGTIIYLEKGYLREHALGALKLQHKILGDIISDHERAIEEEKRAKGKVVFLKGNNNPERDER